MSSRAFAAALAFVLLGLGASVAATWVHYQLAASADYISFCDINATFSCAEAYQSRYGWLLGVPVAVLGAAYFLGLTALLLLGRHLEALAGYVFAAASVALVFVMYLAWATVFVLGTLCVLCLLTYLAVLGLFFVAGWSSALPLTDMPHRLARDLRRLPSSPAALVVLLLLAGSTAAGAALFPRDMLAEVSTPAARPGAQAARQAGPPLTEEQKAQLRANFDAAPRVIVPADAQGAAVVIVKFNDYQCPPCRQTYELYKPIEAKWAREAPGRVRFITRDFPLEAECNPSLTGGSHMAACEAAVAVRLAREQNKGREMEDWLFANQPSLTSELVREGVRTVAGVTDFDARYAEKLALVKSDAALGGTLGVNSTPTFFINGVKLPGMQPQVLDYLIAYELGKRPATSGD